MNFQFFAVSYIFSVRRAEGPPKASSFTRFTLLGRELIDFTPQLVNDGPFFLPCLRCYFSTLPPSDIFISFSRQSDNIGAKLTLGTESL